MHHAAAKPTPTGPMKSMSGTARPTRAITDDRPDEPLGRPHVRNGTEIEIPDQKLKWDQSNPTGHGIVFLSRSRLRVLLRSARRRLIVSSADRNMRAGARPRLGSALVDRHIAIVDPLLVHPLPAETLLSRQRSRRGCGAGRRLVGRRSVLRGRGPCESRLRATQRVIRLNNDRMTWPRKTNGPDGGNMRRLIK